MTNQKGCPVVRCSNSVLVLSGRTRVVKEFKNKIYSGGVYERNYAR
jgi:hypothetical protein